jgi:hypothetical protein
MAGRRRESPSQDEYVGESYEKTALHNTTSLWCFSGLTMCRLYFGIWGRAEQLETT